MNIDKINQRWVKLYFPLALLTFLNAGFLTRSNAQCDNNVSKWYKEKQWLQGVQITPHRSVNQKEFARQYCLDPTWWDKAFEFIKTHDLETLKPGKYVIEENNVVAFISEAPTKEMDQIKWETHKNFNDLQYVIRGKAKMGVASLGTSVFKTTQSYNPKQDVSNYEVEGGKYFVANPKTFFIFSPEDIHHPALKINGHDSIKKLLIKVRVPEG